MESEHRSKFYQHNYGTIAGGAVLSIAGLVLLAIFGGLSDELIGFTFFFSITGVVAMVILVKLGKSFSAGRSLSSRISAVITVGFGGFFIFTVAIPVFASMANFVDRPLLIGSVVGILMLNVLFYFLMGAPTSLGRQMMDGIEGLRTYLNLAEKDRMNLAGSPQMSPEHFQTLLPYAVALGLEKPWSKAFETWLVAAVATGAVAATWRPGWYHGRNFNVDDIGNSMNNISNSMQDSFTAAMPAPKSSSSGFSGGGSSGGGGGGGGGGGW